MAGAATVLGEDGEPERELPDLCDASEDGIDAAAGGLADGFGEDEDAEDDGEGEGEGEADDVSASMPKLVFDSDSD